MLKLSVIVPTYNVEKYLAACLDSLIYPELCDYEIIVVNDGSTDSSLSIAEGFAAKQPELINIISTANGGLGHARNTGLEQARGEFVLFVDSDDTLSINALPEMLQALDSNYDILLFDFQTVDEQGRILSHSKGCSIDAPGSLAEHPQLLHEPVCAWNKIYKRALFVDTGIRFPDRIWFEDLATMPKLYLHAEHIKYVPSEWYLYLYRVGSITRSKNTARNLEMISAVDMCLDYYKKRGKFDMYFAELEYMAVYNQLITSTTRVNLVDRKSPVQQELFEDFVRNFPDYADNKYVKGMSAKLRLLTFLISRKHYLALNFIMRMNNFIKGK